VARLSALQKLDLAEELIDLCADAIRLRHPKAKALLYLRADKVRLWPDARLVPAVGNMRAWVAEHDRANGRPHIVVVGE
jgi:hypothetical protein